MKDIFLTCFVVSNTKFSNNNISTKLKFTTLLNLRYEIINSCFLHKQYEYIECDNYLLSDNHL
jgi:hypothetical protein